MYAIIRSGGRQFRVSQGDTVRLPLLKGDVGSETELGDVLFVGGEDKQHLGTPTVANAKVRAKILRHDRDRKILVYTYKRRKGYEKRRGHRQDFTEVRIEGIEVS